MRSRCRRLARHKPSGDRADAYARRAARAERGSAAAIQRNEAEAQHAPAGHVLLPLTKPAASATTAHRQHRRKQSPPATGATARRRTEEAMLRLHALLLHPCLLRRDLLHAVAPYPHSSQLLNEKVMRMAQRSTYLVLGVTVV